MSRDQRKAAATLLRTLAPAATELGELFTRAGHELALVGGPVRDVFLGKSPADLDLTTDAVPEKVLEIVRQWADKTWTVGIEFGTIGLRKGDTVFEVTTYRSEAYQRGSRKPDVRYGTSLEDDLLRRDFTINAMAARLPDYELVDPFGGLAALKEKVIRTPGRPSDSFSDDPLRILRAARFAARLGFRVDPGVTEAMESMAGRLSIVSVERITDELTKLMLTPDPVYGLDLLVRTGVAAQVVPELPELRMEVDEHHRHKDVYQHSLTVLKQAMDLEDRYDLTQDLVLRLAAVLHDIGKPKTRSLLPGGKVAFHHHEVVGAKMARKRLTELKFSKDVIADVSKLIGLHLRFHGYGDGEWTDSAVRRYVRDAGPMLSRLHVLTRADCTTRNARKAARLSAAYDALEERIEALREAEELDRIRPELDGGEIMSILGLKPGPLVGKARNHLLELRLEHGELGRERVIQELLAWAEGEGLRPADSQ
ncbi:MAG: CCA tRNA nucleotidyltransferase [Streptosporangiales bacterium]|nr:CCA tRNA nucleotidyltransferase [Streptosporangiales bacterium]